MSKETIFIICKTISKLDNPKESTVKIFCLIIGFRLSLLNAKGNEYSISKSWGYFQKKLYIAS